MNTKATEHEPILGSKSRFPGLDWFRFQQLRFFRDQIAVPQGWATILFHGTVFLFGFLIIFSRRPDAILNAQFWAEDGQRWYADAYQFGLRCLLIPDELGGYFHSVSRLAALVSLIFPFSVAPLVMNLCAIAIQILPASIFLSSRFSNIALLKRLVIAFVYFALPATFEVNANATTIQWHLGLLACMVLLAPSIQSWKWHVFDGIVLLLISLDSPVGVVLLPVAAAVCWIRRSRGSVISLALLLPGALIQGVTVLLSHSRPAAPNGANFHRLISILGGQIFISPLLGNTTLVHMAWRHFPNYIFAREIFAFVVGVSILLYALRYAPMELKLFILFGTAILSLSLAHPIPGTLPQPMWEVMSFPGHGNRYYYLPSIAFMASLVWIASSAPKVPRSIAWLLLLMLPLGIVRDWRYPEFVDLHFQEYASKFEAAPPGTKISIPLNPVNAAHWTMELTKH
ncbi:MAG TPA: hypothetical protein VHQ22_12550 [Terriglobales bacterium]|nr:hypothetical protein [Terriglobales bacterium]